MEEEIKNKMAHNLMGLSVDALVDVILFIQEIKMDDGFSASECAEERHQSQSDLSPETQI